MFGLRPIELLLIALVLLLLFGARRLPDLASSLGRSIRGLRGSIAGDGQAVAPKRPAEPRPPAPG